MCKERFLQIFFSLDSSAVLITPQFIILTLMLGLHRTPEGLGTDLRRKSDQTRGYSGVDRQGRMFLLCYSPEGHMLVLNTRNNSGLLAIEIDKVHDRF